MQIFFGTLTEFPQAILGPEESRHCLKVLRHKEGDEIYVTEGKGIMYLAKISKGDLSRTELNIVESFPGYGEQPAHIRLAVSPLRLKDRFEWMMEKAVELGVNEIIPLQTHRTDPYKSKFKASRIEGILLTALKQSKRSQLPVLREMQAYSSWIQEKQQGIKLMGWCEADEHMEAYAVDIKQADTLTLLIGPEGDFTEEEVHLAVEGGFKPISMGENRMRTETAAIFALSAAKFLKAY